MSSRLFGWGESKPGRWQNRIVRAGFIFVASFCFAPVAHACSCLLSYGQMQPCGAYWKADVVFTGVASEIGPMTPVEGSDGRLFSMNGRVTRFAVDSAFRGITGATVETVEHGTSCDYHFKQGERYFVYGSRNAKDGKVYVNSCSATKMLDRAAADIAYARGLTLGERTPGIIGYVMRETRTGADAYRRRVPLRGIKIVVEGARTPVEVKTDVEGVFRVFDLPAGTYRVRAMTPPGLRLLYGKEEVEVQVAVGRCRSAEFTGTSLSTISGYLLDSKGAALGQTKVNLVAVDENIREIPPAEGSIEAYTDVEGRYNFDWVAPGRYLVAVNPQSQPGRSDPPFPRSYYPGVRETSDATVISVADGEHYVNHEFRLPQSLPAGVIEGVVLRPDGRPAAHALVILEFIEREWSEIEGTDAQGRFRLKVYDGFKYLVAGEIRKEVQGVWRGTHSKPIEVVAGAGADQLKLISSEPGFYEPRYVQRKRHKP